MSDTRPAPWTTVSQGMGAVLERDGEGVPFPRERSHGRLGEHADARLPIALDEHRGQLLVEPSQDVGAAMTDGDVGAGGGRHVSELEADVAAADEDDPLTQALGRHEAFAREHEILAGDAQPHGTGAAGDDDVLGTMTEPTIRSVASSANRASPCSVATPASPSAFSTPAGAGSVNPRLNAMSEGQSRRRSPVGPLPRCAAARSTTSAAVNSTFLGSQPRRMQVPPYSRRSTMATRWPPRRAPRRRSAPSRRCR